jgi:hypothetical protein
MTLGLLLIGNNIWLEVMEMDTIGALSTLCERLVLKPKVRLFFPQKLNFEF